MSYDVTKLTQLGHLKSLAEKVAAECPPNCAGGDERIA